MTTGLPVGLENNGFIILRLCGAPGNPGRFFVSFGMGRAMDSPASFRFTPASLPPLLRKAVRHRGGSGAELMREWSGDSLALSARRSLSEGSRRRFTLEPGAKKEGASRRAFFFYDEEPD